MARQLYRPHPIERETGEPAHRRLARHNLAPAEFAPPDVFLDDLDPAAWEDGYAAEFEPDDTTPSLPVILISAACGLGGGVIGLYLSHRVFGWPVVWVAAATTLALLFSLGMSGALVSVVTGAKAAPANILFSCGLVIAAGLFLGLCLVGGALGATLLFGV